MSFVRNAFFSVIRSTPEQLGVHTQLTRSTESCSPTDSFDLGFPLVLVQLTGSSHIRLGP